MNKILLIELTGGLGNQFYQYALFLHLKQQGAHCYLHPYRKYLNEHDGLILSHVFPRSSVYISNSWWIDGYLSAYDKLDVIRGACYRHLKSIYSFFSRHIPFNRVIFPMWENYTFIEQIGDKESFFKFPMLDERNQTLLNEIKAVNSVSIHVRRGDYQSKKKWRINLGDICDENYYKEALKIVYDKIPSPVFFVFSDDIEWVKQNLSIPEARYCDWNKGIDSYKDMQLMAACKVIICANSTFSLMASWLNTNSNSLTIVPGKWINQREDYLFDRYIPKNKKDWVVVDNRRPQVSIRYEGIFDENILRMICNQTYTDFEVLNVDNHFLEIDERLTNNDKPRGNYIYHVSNIESFFDVNHLHSWVMEQFTDCEE